nr:hypothetical protein [Fibrobacterota bacterium]
MTNHHNHHNTVLAAFTAIALLAAGNLHAQPATAECSLRGADTLLITGVTTKKCLDVAALNGTSTIIPSNVTRIDNNGFSLCESSEQSGGQADIVYVMDQSGSMGLKFIWISPNLKDTVFLESTANCKSLNDGDATGFGTITVPYDAGVRNIPRLNPNKPITGCTSFA